MKYGEGRKEDTCLDLERESRRLGDLERLRRGDGLLKEKHSSLGLATKMRTPKKALEFSQDVEIE